MSIKITSDTVLNSSLLKKAGELATSIESTAVSAPIQPVAFSSADSKLASEVSANYAKAALNIQESKDAIISSFKEILNKYFVKGDEKISPRIIFRPKDGLVRFRIGNEISGFPGLIRENKRICAYYDKNSKPSRVYSLSDTGGIDLLDFETSTMRHYSKEDVDALQYYKYHPNALHMKLRHNKGTYSGDFKGERDNVIVRLGELFKDDSKVLRSKSDGVLYRALQPDLTPEDIQELTKLGGVFTEKSFCSTSTNLNSAIRLSCKNSNFEGLFPNGRAILKIEIPKGSKYFNMDEMFNIDLPHWKEDEFLLNKGSKFLVTGVDKENGFINVKYLGD